MKRTRGFVLITVVLVLAVLAAMAVMLSSSASMNAALVARHSDSTALDYLAAAGMQHLKWQLAQNTSCSNYTSPGNTAFGAHHYDATFSASNGSPVTMAVTATLNSGVSKSVSETTRVYLAPTPRVFQPGADLDDAYTWEGVYGGTNFGASPILSVNNAGTKRTSLLRFDLSAIPAGARIHEATLELYLTGGRNLSNGVIDVHRLTRWWMEGIYDGQPPPAPGGVTYQSFNGQTNWDSFGGDYEANVIDSVTIASLSTGWYAWNVASAVDSWVRLGAQNHGFLLRASAGTANMIEFASGDSATAARWPKLSITYSCECGANCTAGDAPGLLAHWKLDDATGSKAIDAIGGHNGTLTSGPGWAAGKLDGALSFDGVDDFVEVGHHDILSLTGEMTFSAWIKLQSIGSGYSTILSKDGGSGDSNYWFGVFQQELAFGFYTGGNFREVFTSGLDLQKDVWYHVAASFNNATDEVVLYKDGSKAASSNSLSHEPSAIDAPVRIGRSATGKFWQGALDDVRIYERALPATEVAELYQDGIQHVPLLFVVANAGSATKEEAERQALIETWGYAVTVIADSDSPANFASAVAANAVAYVSEEVSHNELGNKLRDAAIGVVNEERMQYAELGFANAVGTQSGTMITLTNNTHEITTGFALGSLQIAIWGQPLQFLQGTRSPDLQTLANQPATTSPALALLDTGDALQNGGTANGRRVWLPWGGDWFTFSTLNSDGKTIMQRAIAWAATGTGGAACSGTFRDEFGERKYSNSDGSLNWATNWLEIDNNDGGPLKKDEQVTNNSELQVQNNKSGGKGIEREADLSAYKSAVLSFEYRRDSLDKDSDYVAVEVSRDGGSNWKQLEKFEGAATDSSNKSFSRDISGYIAANTRIRFISSPTLGKKDRVLFDNVEICVKK